MRERQVITVEQDIAAPPSAVYAHLTRAEQWARWQGTDATLAPEPGGIFRIRMGTGQTARGEFVELVPDRKVVFTWAGSTSQASRRDRRSSRSSSNRQVREPSCG